MSGERLTAQDRADLVDFLSRVVPRGAEEADRLHRLIQILTPKKNV